MIIGVIGAGSCSDEIYRTAEETGRLIAESGAVLITGGLGGVMEAASRGAREAGGTVVGILPGASPDDANSYVDIPVVTGMGHARNVIIVRTADALIALSGEYGTLSEIAVALKLGKPVIGIDTWKHIPGIIEADNPREAVGKVLELVGSG